MTDSKRIFPPLNIQVCDSLPPGVWIAYTPVKPHTPEDAVVAVAMPSGVKCTARQVRKLSQTKGH